tara:strand:- start:2479 stop:3264 length:786 start_codon:yes stop_codon:yes gene_type:complete
MNIGIIGIGVLGKAYLNGFKKWGHNVITYDIKGKYNFRYILKSDVVFLCVPSPSNKDGRCDTSIVESVISKLNISNYKGIISIASTVEIGFTTRVSKKFKNLKICSVPELLKERSASKDFLKNKIVVIGTDSRTVYNKVKKCFKNKNCFLVKHEEAEIFKYFNNCYAALRIIFANIFYEISLKNRSNYKKIKDIYISTGKAVDMYLNVNKDLRGFAGMCLPKDVKAMKHYLKKNKINFDLIKYIDLDNQKLKKTVFRGMRK